MGQQAKAIPEKIYFKIGEVCELVGVQAHVLRYWETEFSQLSPQKNRSGQRSYRRRDVEIALKIKELLYEDMYTIAGARKKLQAEARHEAPKLKIVHSERREAQNPDAAPSLFDDEVDLADLDLDDVNGGTLSIEQIEAIRSLTSQLLELRSMLKTDQTREAADHLENRRV